MGGGPEDQFLEGSVLGASFWRWWNRAWTGEPVKEEVTPVASVKPEEICEELVAITAVVPRRQAPPPPRPPSKPIDIPTRKPVPARPVFESVPEDKRYWYQ